jgi:hypothetical protein
MGHVGFCSVLMMLKLLCENTCHKERLALDASKKVGLEVNVEETKYMFISCHQAAAQTCYFLYTDP